MEETEDSNGYRITYSLNDELFKDNAVYTLSISDKDAAGNINDTRMFEETNDITFGVQHTEVLGAQATRADDDDYNEESVTNKAESNTSEQNLQTDGTFASHIKNRGFYNPTAKKVLDIVKTVLAVLILILLILQLVLKIRDNKRE